MTTPTEPISFTKALEAIYFLTAQEGLEKAKVERNTAEMQRAGMEAIGHECRRPWRIMGATIAFDSDTGKWRCEFQGVVALGETPEMACDNFDHLWMFGQ
jgi:hypothetical protein